MSDPTPFTIKDTTQTEVINRLERLESSLMSGLQEIRTLREELAKRNVETDTLDKLLDADEVAELLGVDKKYVYAMARKKQIPSIRVGDRYVKFSPSQLRKFFDTRSDC
jgi:excisionase family DNA binding protein